MMTIRYPNGQAVTYNDAHYLKYGSVSWDLYTGDGGRWICSISPASGAIVEVCRPCSVENPIIELTEERAEAMVADMLEEERHKNGNVVARIKRALNNFDARWGGWK